jgi:hypothetical protein
MPRTNPIARIANPLIMMIFAASTFANKRRIEGPQRKVQHWSSSAARHESNPTVVRKDNGCVCPAKGREKSLDGTA